MENKKEDLNVKNCWDRRSRVIKKCKEKKMFKKDLDLLEICSKNKDREIYMTIIKRYFSWLFHYEIFNYPKFIDCYRFTGDLALVQNKNGAFGFINDKNKFILEAKYDDIYVLDNEFAIVKVYGTFTLFDKIERRFDYKTTFDIFNDSLEWYQKKGIKEHA